ncbi:MAG: YkvA family protein [Oscillospiraceae bacterium]|nr:YkvA family protein [Oscillospiraceae bacterium]
MNLKERAKQLKIDIPAVFIALKKKETPIIAKFLAGVTVLYALSPIDLIPDFIPVLGYLDDLIILPGLIAITIKLIPKELFAECRIQAEELWKNGKPKKWYYALPITIIWIILIWIIIKAIWH